MLSKAIIYRQKEGKKEYFEIRVFDTQDKVSMVIKLKELIIDNSAMRVLLEPFERGNQE